MSELEISPIRSRLRVAVALCLSPMAAAPWKKWGMYVLGFSLALKLGVPEDRHVAREPAAFSI